MEAMHGGARRTEETRQSERVELGRENGARNDDNSEYGRRTGSMLGSCGRAEDNDGAGIKEDRVWEGERVKQQGDDDSSSCRGTHRPASNSPRQHRSAQLLSQLRSATRCRHSHNASAVQWYGSRKGKGGMHRECKAGSDGHHAARWSRGEQAMTKV